MAMDWDDSRWWNSSGCLETQSDVKYLDTWNFGLSKVSLFNKPENDALFPSAESTDWNGLYIPIEIE